MNIGLDLDGTILTCAPRHIGLMQAAARQLGLQFDAYAFWSLKREGLDNRRALEQLRLPVQQVARLCSIWSASIESLPWLDFDQPFDGVEQCLADWRAGGHRLHVITARSNASMARVQIERLGLTAAFDSFTVVNVAQPVSAKATALMTHHCDLMIGDSDVDAQAAQSANVRFIGVASGMRSTSALHGKGVATVMETLVACSGLASRECAVEIN